jgi:hypothetical protein
MYQQPLLVEPFTPSSTNRRWVGWLVVLCIGGLLLAKVMNAPLATSAQASPNVVPIAESQPAVALSASSGLAIASLITCGQPGRVGVFHAGDTPCQPASTWTLAEFAQQLVPLNVLASGETLAAPPTPADASCPLTIMRGSVATGARLCFTPAGGVYRDTGSTRNQAWSWQFTPAGQWTLSTTIAVAHASN